MSIKCYKCGKHLDLSAGKDIHRSENCTSCFSSIRCCRMCEFYDTKAYNDCREPTADRIVDKEKANFCDFFKLASSSNNIEENTRSAVDIANALFKK